MTQKVVVVGGCGHVGLPLAIALADQGSYVEALDIDEFKNKEVNEGRMPFLEEGIRCNKDRGDLVTSNEGINP